MESQRSRTPVLAKITAVELDDPSLRHLVSRAVTYAKETAAPRTIDGYRRDFERFESWAATTGKGLPTLPTNPEIVAVYLAALADGAVRVEWVGRGNVVRSSMTPKKYATIERAYNAICWTHRVRGYEWPHAHPLIVRVMRGIRRAIGVKPNRVAPLEIGALARCLAGKSADLAFVRDRALLSLGFFGGFRRSDIAGLVVGDIEFVPRGIVVHLRKSKTDQERAGEDTAIPFAKNKALCPVLLMKAWLKASKLAQGPLFRRIDKAGSMGPMALTPQAVSNIVKLRAEAAGLDPTTLSAHSLRAGLATSAACAGKTLENIMRQGRWKSAEVAASYIRPATLFDQNAADGLA